MRHLLPVRSTPVSVTGLRSLDHLPALDAVIAAWQAPGSHPGWHQDQQDALRRSMPLLARALDRLR